MERLFLECTVRAALLVAGTAILLYVMRVKAAAAKHSVWAGVLALMLVLPVWTVWGPRAPLRLLPALPQTTGNGTIAPAGTPPTAFLPSPLISTWQAVLVGVYLLGLGLFLFRLALGTVRARRLIRNSVLYDGMRTSTLCATPVTVGFFPPVTIFPEQWRQWSHAQLDAVLTHEGEHARRRDPLVQWLALLNRAFFWFHPAAWWLERTLSALAEEACDTVVLARGHNPREYAECLIDMARSVTRSGARLNVTGMAMPGSLLPQRIRRIVEGAQAPGISRTRMTCVAVLCAITCTAFAAGTLEHARQNSSTPSVLTQSATKFAAHPGTGFVLADLKIEGDVHDRVGVRDRILRAWRDQEYGNVQDLVGAVTEQGVRKDFQDRGYFKVLLHDPTSQVLGVSDGKQRILVTVPVAEDGQYRLRTLTFQGVPPDRTLSVPAATLREQFHLRAGDLFNVSEVRAGMERVAHLYGAQGYKDANVEPETDINDASHRIDLMLRITEGPHKS